MCQMLSDFALYLLSMYVAMMRSLLIFTSGNMKSIGIVAFQCNLVITEENMQYL